MLDLNELRRRILANEPYTREELREALTALRTVRTPAAEATITKRTAKAAAAPISDADLDASLRAAGLDI